MRNPNRWRWAAATATILAVGTAAVWPKGGEDAPDNVPNTAPSTSAACTGNIVGVTYKTFTKDGDAFTVDAIKGGDCAPIYKPEDSSVIGSVRVGEVVLACTFLGSKPDRLHVMNPISGEPYVVGDSNLTPEGVKEVGIEDVPSCISMGVPDIGFRFPEDLPIDPSESARVVRV